MVPEDKNEAIKKEEIKKEEIKKEEVKKKETQSPKSGKWKKIGLVAGGLALAAVTSPLYLSTKVLIGTAGEVVKVEILPTEGYVAPKCQWDEKKVCDIQNRYVLNVWSSDEKHWYRLPIQPSDNRPIEVLKASIGERSVPNSLPFDHDGNKLYNPRDVSGSYIIFENSNCSWFSGVHHKNPIDYTLNVPSDKIFVITTRNS